MSFLQNVLSEAERPLYLQVSNPCLHKGISYTVPCKLTKSIFRAILLLDPEINTGAYHVS